MRPINRLFLATACIHLVCPVHTAHSANKRSKRSARLVVPRRVPLAGAKKNEGAAPAESFHGNAVAGPWQFEGSYMPMDFDGVKMAEEIAIGAMFDRIVAQWPGAEYASSSSTGGIIQIENFVTPEEADYLIKLGHEAGLEGSVGTGAKQADGSFKVRSCTATSKCEVPTVCIVWPDECATCFRSIAAPPHPVPHFEE
jgi:hypothetical protein